MCLLYIIIVVKTTISVISKIESKIYKGNHFILYIISYPYKMMVIV